MRHRYNYLTVLASEESMVSEGGGSSGRKTFALVLLCCASFVAVLDLTIVAIALPSVRRELGFSGGDVQWILTGYALSFGGPPAPYGPRRRPLRPAAPVRIRARLVRRRLSVGGTGVGALGAGGRASIAGGRWGGARTGLACASGDHLRGGRGAKPSHGRLRRDGWGWVCLRDGARGCDHGVPGLAVGAVRERARGDCGALARAGGDPREQRRGGPAYAGPGRCGDGHPRTRLADLRGLRGAEERMGLSRHARHGRAGGRPP